MRRFYLTGADALIVAEGVLFSSGMAAVSFLPSVPGARSVTVDTDLGAVRAVHVGLGGRRLVWDTRDFDPFADPLPSDDELKLLTTSSGATPVPTVRDRWAVPE